MSASQEKKKRREDGFDNVSEKREKRKKQESKTKRTNAVQISIIAVVLLLIVAVFVVNSNLFYTGVSALDIGGTSYTTAQFNYFYNSAYLSFMTEYGDYASMFGLDTSKPLSSQQYTEEMTWADYFEQSALDTMKQLTFINDEAKKAGFELSQESKDQVAASIEELKSAYAVYGYNSLDHYLTSNYGKGASVEMVEELVTMSAVASEYSQSVVDGYEYSESELEDYYTENKDTYDFITYRQFFFSGAADDEAGIDEETAMADAKDKAEAMAKAATSEETFSDLAYENAAEESKESYEDSEATLYTNQGQNLNSSFSEWLLDSGRVAGDCEAIEASNGYYVIMYVERTDNHYNTRSVRHILIKAEADEEGLFTDEAKAEALAGAEELYAEWQDGDATEDSFAALADEHSDDGGSNTVGGLYENIYKNQMVEEFNDFCFDEGRQYGDSGIVYGEASNSYAGYHIMFYVGKGELYSSYIAKSAKQNEDYGAWLEAGLENYEPVTKFAFRFSK